MGSGATVTISTAVVMLTQALKPHVPEGWGLKIAILLSALGVGLWSASNTGFSVALVWSQFAAFVEVLTVAVGVFHVAAKPKEPEAPAAPEPPGDGGESGRTGGVSPLTLAVASIAALVLVSQ